MIGHAMANHSPYFKDLEGWRNDHTDWLRRDVLKFRRRLQRLLARGRAQTGADQGGSREPRPRPRRVEG